MKLTRILIIVTIIFFLLIPVPNEKWTLFIGVAIVLWVSGLAGLLTALLGLLCVAALFILFFAAFTPSWIKRNCLMALAGLLFLYIPVGMVIPNIYRHGSFTNQMLLYCFFTVSVITITSVIRILRSKKSNTPLETSSER